MQIVLKRFQSKALAFVFAVISTFAASNCYGKIVTLGACQKFASEMATQYPQKRKLFTTLKPECVTDAEGKIKLRIMMQANKNNERADDIREPMAKAALESVRKVVCHQQDTTDLLQMIDVRFAVKLEESESIISSFDITYEECKEESKKTVDVGSSIGMDMCKNHIATNKSGIPRKLSDTVTVTGLECRKGESKEVALVMFHTLSGGTFEGVSAGLAQNKVAIKDSMRKSLCENGVIRGLLQALDISITYKVMEREVGSIVFTSKDCN